jgi:predicted flap endonuclease-1-like 5' DNA nuclease
LSEAINGRRRAPTIPYQARSARANKPAADLAPIIAELQATGITSLKGIAAALNKRGVPTPAGIGHWHAAQVSRVLKRLAAGAAKHLSHNSRL